MVKLQFGQKTQLEPFSHKTNFICAAFCAQTLKCWFEDVSFGILETKSVWCLSQEKIYDSQTEMNLLGEKITSVMEPMAGIMCCFNLQLPRGYDVILQHFYINASNYVRRKAVENERHQPCLFMGCATHISATFFLSFSFSP